MWQALLLLIFSVLLVLKLAVLIGVFVAPLVCESRTLYKRLCVVNARTLISVERLRALFAKALVTTLNRLCNATYATLSTASHASPCGHMAQFAGIAYARISAG